MTARLQKYDLNLLVVGLFVLIQGCITGDDAAQSSGSKMSSELNQVALLLDSWSGSQAQLGYAEKIITNELESDPKNVHGLRQLARLTIRSGYISGKRYRAGTFEQAERILLQAIEIEPEFAEAYLTLGYVYDMSERLLESREALLKAEELGTDDPWLHLNWASLHKKFGQFDKMLERYEAVASSGTQDKHALSSAYRYLAEEKIKTGNIIEAKRYFEKRIELYPQNAWLIGNYADFLRNHVGDFDASIENARLSLDIMDYGVGRRILALSLYSKWADLLAKNTDEQKPRAFYQEAFELYPDISRVVAHLGAFETTVGAVDYLVDMGASLNGTTRSGATALYYAASYGRTDLALKLLEMGLDPDVPDHQNTTALNIAIIRNKSETAIALLRKGVNPSPGDPVRNAIDVAKSKMNNAVVEEISRLSEL